MAHAADVQSNARDRVLVVASELARRETLVARLSEAGFAAASSPPEALATAVHFEAPRLLVLEAGSAERVRTLLLRARAAAEASLPAVLLLPDRSSWLRGAQPPGLEPCAVLPSTAAPAALIRALRTLANSEDTPFLRESTPTYEASSTRWHPDRRELTGPAGTAYLTSSEATLYSLLDSARGGVVTSERAAQALWNAPQVDQSSRAALRTHVYTLRRKLEAVGLAGTLLTVPGSGYRLLEPVEAGSLVTA